MPPDISERDVIIVDPMLATGGSAAAAAMFLKEVGVKHNQAHEHNRRAGGRAAHAVPSIRTWTSSSPALDDHLNEHGYIVPRPRGRGRPHFRHENKRSSNYLKQSPKVPLRQPNRSRCAGCDFLIIAGLPETALAAQAGALHPGAAWRRRNRDCGLFCKSGKARANLSR